MEEIKGNVLKTLESFSNEYYIPRSFELCRYDHKENTFIQICVTKDIKNFVEYDEWQSVFKRRDYVVLISRNDTYIVRTSSVKVL